MMSLWLMLAAMAWRTVSVTSPQTLTAFMSRNTPSAPGTSGDASPNRSKNTGSHATVSRAAPAVTSSPAANTAASSAFFPMPQGRKTRRFFGSAAKTAMFNRSACSAGTRSVSIIA